MSDLEKFLHDQPVRTPVLLKAALAHVQFETIHPFLDGNGRVGRLLITLLLYSEKVLRRPLLYLSLYLKRHRDAYYDHLQRVRTEGAWEEWLGFFFRESSRWLPRPPRRPSGSSRWSSATGKGSTRSAGELPTAHRVHELATRRVVLRASSVASQLELSDPPVYAAIARLQEAGILSEVTGRKRGRVYAYDEYLALLNEGTTEPI